MAAPISAVTAFKSRIEINRKFLSIKEFSRRFEKKQAHLLTSTGHPGTRWKADAHQAGTLVPQ
jgi:hypothetical protein